jgi:hypothetical protein|tara:strand:- start:551 stop:1003 length:453 start_codon:yes stop_codon:yes gene_type:complete
MATKLNENTELSMPIRNLFAMVVGAVIGTWAYFGIVERLNTIENKLLLSETDVGMNTEFRIKWPRGEMGSLPADSEQFMLIEHLAGELDKLAENIETGQAPFDQQQTLTLDFYKDRIETLETEVKEIRKDMMQMVHDMNGMKAPSKHSGH